MSLSKFLLRLFGWKVRCTAPAYPKCIICVAPHTSNWDFVLGELAYWSVGRKAGFLMKSTWFFFPMNLLFKALGGVPVDRKNGSSLTQVMTERFTSTDRLNIAITPEGTRKKVTEWHTGFLRIAHDAGIPIILGAINAPTKEIFLEKTFVPTGDIESDMKQIKAYYAPFVGVKAENS